VAKPKVAQPLRDLIVPIDSLKPWPGNPRQGDIDAMAASLKTNGQYRPAVVQKSSGQICAGNHMWLAAKDELRWDGIAAVVVDLTDEQAKRILAADNGVGEKGTFNEFLLAELLTDLSGTDLGLAGTGYDPADLEDLANMISAPATLDELHGEHGTWDDTGDVTPSDSAKSAETPGGWPAVSIACPPKLKARFDRAFNALDGEPWERLEIILEAYEETAGGEADQA
jgi:hypothetical protein